MRKSDQKRARLAVQPRLTAFLQPKPKQQSSEEHIHTLGSNPALLAAGEQTKGSVKNFLEHAQSGGNQSFVLRNDRLQWLERHDSVKVEAATSSNPQIKKGADSFQKKSSLEGFLKRKRTTPAELRGKESGQNLHHHKAADGRTLHGSAYAQCPICTVQIPLTRMNHHLDIECVKQAAACRHESSAGKNGEKLRTSDDLIDGKTQLQEQYCGRENVSEAERRLSEGQVASDSTRLKRFEQPFQENQNTDNRREVHVPEGSEASGGSSRDSEIMPTLNEWLPSEGETRKALTETTLETNAEEGKDLCEKDEALQIIGASHSQAGVQHSLVAGQGELIHTPGPAQREPVNTLLGMVREKGQRPLFGLSWAALQMRQPSAPKGHYLVENFLSEEEEAHIIASLDADDSNPWKTSRVLGDLNQGKAYGVVTDLRRRTLLKPKRPMPAFLQSVLERIRTVAPPLSEFVPNECNAINYCKSEGHWLRAHVDDRQLSGTIIAGISLHTDCVMTYEKERGRPERFRVRLPRRCLQVQTSDSRYNYTHSIKNADLLGDRRVSITFRQVAAPQP